MDLSHTSSFGLHSGLSELQRPTVVQDKIEWLEGSEYYAWRDFLERRPDSKKADLIILHNQVSYDSRKNLHF